MPGSNQKTPLTFVYTALKPPLYRGDRLPWPELARTINDVHLTDIRIRMPGHDFNLAARQLRRLWQRRPRRWRGMPIVGFWLLGRYGEPAFVYMKFGDYESTAHTIEEESWPPEAPRRQGWTPGEPGPAWHYVDPDDLARAG